MRRGFIGAAAGALGALVAGIVAAAPADAVYPVTGTTTSASPSEIAGCSADQSARSRDPLTQIYWFKRGQVWFVSAASDTQASFCFIYGNPGDIGVVGTWGFPGVTWPTPGVFRPSTGEWFLSGSEFGSSAAQVRRLGGPGDVPVVGDWNADGVDDIGVVRGTTWYLQTDPSSIVAQGTRTIGRSGDIPVGGSPAGLGYSTPSLELSVYRPSIASFVTYADSGEVRTSGTAGVHDVPVAPIAIRDDPTTTGAFLTDVYRPAAATLFRGSTSQLIESYTPVRIGQAGDQVLRAGVTCTFGSPCAYPHPQP